MIVFKIPESLYDSYKGAGHAVASVKNDDIVDFFYVSDFIPEFDPEFDSLEGVIRDPRLIVPVNSLVGKGEIYFGMCSSYEFVVL